MTLFDWALCGVWLMGVIGMIYAFYLMKGGYQWEILPKRIKSRLFGRMLFYVFMFFAVMWVGVLKQHEVENVQGEYQGRVLEYQEREAEVAQILDNKRFFYLPSKRLRDIKMVLEGKNERGRV